MSGLATQAGMFRGGAGGGSPVAASIVSLWDFESGARTDDSTGNNDLTQIGSPTYSAGKIGDGVGGFSSSDYLRTTTMTGFTATSVKTLSGWFKTTSSATAQSSIMTMGNANGVAGDIVNVSIENGVAWIRCDGGRVGNYGGSFNDGDWHFISVIVPEFGDMSDIIVYLDGVELVGSISNDGLISITDPATLAVGATRQNAQAINIFSGEADQIMIADTAWSLSDHQYCYNSGTGRPTNEILGQ